jgi:hypothetical protein
MDPTGLMPAQALDIASADHHRLLEFGLLAWTGNTPPGIKRTSMRRLFPDNYTLRGLR